MSDEKNFFFYLQSIDYMGLSYQSIFRYYHSVKGLYRFPFHIDEEEQNAPITRYLNSNLSEAE